MAKIRRPEPGPGPAAPHFSTRTASVVVPRAWLIVVTILLVIPWLVVGAIYVHDDDGAAADATPAGSGVEVTSGPWGQLVTTPIVISPPAEYVPRNWGPLSPALWHVPVSGAAELRSFLASVGLETGDIARLESTARPHPQAGGVVLQPETELVQRMAPAARARLYERMGGSHLNADQITAYRFFGASPESWIGASVSPRTLDLVKPLIYRRGEFMYFADVEAIRPQIEDPAELQRLAKALYRQATLLVSVRIDRPADVPALAEYWGRGGRRTDIRPLLESIAEGGAGRSIDVSHLLPTMAREHLYRYPKVTVADHEKPILANCLWTALNFFQPTPDDRFLDVEYALTHLKRDYYIVHDQYQLGDIVVFSDRDGNLFHAAVYVADDLVFGKNGITPMAPWSILPIERIKGHYVDNSQDWQVTFHRRMGL